MDFGPHRIVRFPGNCGTRSSHRWDRIGRRRDLSGNADRWRDFTHRAAPVRRLSAERRGEAIVSLPQLSDLDEKK